MLVISREKREGLFVLDKAGKLVGLVKAGHRNGGRVRIGLHFPKEMFVIRAELTEHVGKTFDELLEIPFGTIVKVLPRPAREKQPTV